jgi:tetratricopeptide (TPR) repeat protein
VAKKHKKQRAPQLSSAELAARVRRAQREGRSQQALELAKQLHRQEPTPAHKDLLKQAYLERARHLRYQGYLKDAGTVLEAALPLADDDPAWLGQATEELAACGQVRQALALLDRFPDLPARSRVLAQGVDHALRKGAAGRNLLPPALQGPFDRIFQAFGHLEAGQDDQARQAVQEISLQSPFLEWKLLIRGLIAYYQPDDPRALENWQRLNADRLPARLVAPLRFTIDRAYRTAQEPETQAALQKQADRLQGAGPVQTLRSIQAALATSEQLARAFRLAEDLLPDLRQNHPQLIPRLASCFYWAIVTSGMPEDMNRYRRVFGEPPDDPGFARLQALVAEHQGLFAEAHKHWQHFEQGVANHPETWPGAQAVRVRALVWCHMGRNAAHVPTEDQMAKLPAFLRDHPNRPRALSPSAEECFRRSQELAADQLEPYEELFHYYLQTKKLKKAEQAGRKLLERFPDHVRTLEELGDLVVERENYPEGIALYERALKANPLERRLRTKLGTTHLFYARAQAEAGRFDDARAEYRTSLALDNSGEAAVLCKWAACEFKAADAARAEELLGQAMARAGGRLPIAFSMLIEVIRLKLPGSLKTRFNREFNESLAEPPTAAAAVDVVDTAAHHKASGVTYHGQKTHEKKVLAYLEKARQQCSFTEDQLQKVCEGLLALGVMRPLRAFTALARQQFPNNPHFPFLEAESYFAGASGYVPIWQVGPLLEEASRLAGRLPPDEETKALWESIRDRQQELQALNPFGNLFQTPFSELFGDEEDDWADPDDGDWDSVDEWDDDEEGPFFDPFDRPQRKRRRRR